MNARLALLLAASALTLSCAHRQESLPPPPPERKDEARGPMGSPAAGAETPGVATVLALPRDQAVGGETAREAIAQVAGPKREPAAVAAPAAVELRARMPAPPADADLSAESYAHVAASGFRRTADSPISTFSVDVDTASYSNVRRFLLDERRLPPADAVRIEELLNTFRYDDPEPRGGDPFSVTTELADCPWAPEHRLLRVGLRGRSVAPRDLPARNLVFLIDVSGSMDHPAKLPLVKTALAGLVRGLGARDRVSVVVYAGAAGLVLEPTPGDRRDEILDAIERLQPGGSTHGSQGIRLAYDLAEDSFLEGGANRVVLCTDGDFNVGVTSHGELVRLVEEEREKGVFLTVLGFGRGNLKDSTMEALADHGNGNYAYLDSKDEARKVLVEEADAWLVTIAKDVKIQVEMNPGAVAGWRLIGYENRALATEDFEDDRKDAGEIGAGHAVVALYEIVPAGGEVPGSPADGPRRYQPEPAPSSRRGELALVQLRWKEPDAHRSELVSHVVGSQPASLASASDDLRFAAGVAAFGLALRGDELAPGATLALAERLAEGALGDDATGRRAELVELVRAAQGLRGVAVLTTK